MNKIKLNITGNVFGIDGYSNHTRSLFNALYKHPELDVKLQTQLPQNWIQMCNDAEFDAITKPERKEDWNIIITIPHMWKQFLGLGKNAVYCIWEGDKVPKSWIEEFLNPKIDLIFVASEHTKSAIFKTGIEWMKEEYKEGEKEQYGNILLSYKIKVIPHGIDRSIFYNQRKKDSNEAQDVLLSGDTNYEQGKTKNVEHIPVNEDTHSDIFKFYCNKGWRGTSWDRGGVQYLLKAFAEEFRKDEKVELIIKLNPAYINPQQIGNAIQQLNLPEDRAQIRINCENLSLQKLNELCNSTDCYVCATRCDAFNLGGMEAMACGLPTLQTNFGGQTDYMTDKNSLFINHKLDDVKEDLMYEGIQWSTPDIMDLRTKMRWAFNNQDKIKEMGKQAEEDSKKWTWDISANKIVDYIKLKGG